MLKILKKVLIICLIVFIQFLIIVYKIISKFWEKNNTDIKKIIKSLDEELRIQLQ